MPPQLLPRSAAAFSARAPPNIVLATKVDPFMTTTLRRVARRRPLNSATQQTRCLTELLAKPTALWNLCSLFFQRAPHHNLVKDSNPLVEAVSNYEMIAVQAYVVHVDMVSQNEVAFKLTTDSIDALIKYHRNVHTIDAKNRGPEWPDKELHAKKLHEHFIQAVNKFIYRTNADVLEGLEEDGAGELLQGRADGVRSAILALFLPLSPPPPPSPPARILPSSSSADFIHNTPIVPSSNFRVEEWQWSPEEEQRAFLQQRFHNHYQHGQVSPLQSHRIREVSSPLQAQTQAPLPPASDSYTHEQMTTLPQHQSSSQSQRSWNSTPSLQYFDTTSSGSNTWSDIDISDFQLPLDLEMISDSSPLSSCTNSLPATPSSEHFLKFGIPSCGLPPSCAAPDATYTNGCDSKGLAYYEEDPFISPDWTYSHEPMMHVQQPFQSMRQVQYVT